MQNTDLTMLLLVQFKKEKSMRPVITEIVDAYPQYTRETLRQHIRAMKKIGLLHSPGRAEVYRRTEAGEHLLKEAMK